MNRIPVVLGAAFVAASLVSGGALAADSSTNNTAATSSNKADKTQVVPSRDDLKPGAAPSVQRMDDNAQRAHDRDSGTASKGKRDTAAKSGDGTAAKSGDGVTSSSSATSSSTPNSADVRDWAQIDKNNDHLIGPEEMEEWLKQAGPKAAPQKKS